jgi:hypothetical protein
MTRPAKTRALTKRDQREWLARIPVVLSEPIQHVSGGHWLWRPKPGHRGDHCTVSESPFKATGYILKLDPAYAEIEAKRLRQVETMRLRRALAEFQSREIAEQECNKTEQQTGGRL